MALIPDDPKQRNAVVAAVLTAGLFYVFWAFWYTPRKTEVTEMEARLEQLEANNRTAQIIATRGGRELEERLQLYERHVARLEQLIPRSEEVAALLNDITAESRRTGVEIAAMKPEPEERGDFYTKQSYALDVVGAYHDIGRFLTNIASLPRIITPVHLDLSNFRGQREALRVETDQPLTASLQIQTYILPPPRETPPESEGVGEQGGSP